MVFFHIIMIIMETIFLSLSQVHTTSTDDTDDFVTADTTWGQSTTSFSSGTT